MSGRLRRAVLGGSAILALLPLLSSCSVSDFVKKGVDTDRLYIGGYPVVRNDDGSVFDYYFYFSFVDAGSVDSVSQDADFVFDLNDSSLTTFGDSMYGTPHYVDVADCFRRKFHGSSLSSFFSSGGLVCYWTSVGKSDPSGSFMSARSYLTGSGKIVSLSTISTSGEALESKISYYYSEKWRI